MNCWHCQTELIWGGDHDCESYVEVHLPDLEHEDHKE